VAIFSAKRSKATSPRVKNLTKIRRRLKNAANGGWAPQSQVIASRD